MHSNDRLTKNRACIGSKLCADNSTKTKYLHKCIGLRHWKQSEYPLQLLLNNPHSNLQQIHKYHESDTQITLIIHHCEGGNLLDSIHKHGAYSTNKARKIFTQMMSVIQHIDSCECVHRDIRPEDILFTDHTPSCIQLSHTIFECNTNTITLYQSPQLRKYLTVHQQMNRIHADIRNDIWSLGLLLYLMLNGSLPSYQYEEITEMIHNKSLKWCDDKKIALSAKDLIYKMLRLDHNKRISIQQIKQHPFVLDFDDMVKKKTDCNQEDKQEKRYTLKQKILFALRSTKLRPMPSQKEMQESFAFFERVQKYFKRHDVIIDVCGSHGLISYLFALYCRTPFIYIIDSHQPKSFEMIGNALNVRDGTIEYIAKDLYEALPELLELWRQKNKKIAVIACHACAHLSDSIMDMCHQCDMTEFALMPCCHARNDHYHQVGAIADTLNVDLCHRKSVDCDVTVKNLKKEDKTISAGTVKDMIMFGRGIQMGYSMRWRMIPAKITPQNRILFGLKPNEKERKIQNKIVNKRKIRMERAYHKNDV